MTPEEGRAMVMHRALGCCEVQVEPDCRPDRPEWHHRQSRRTRQHGPENGIAACRACHAWVHAHPETSITNGWIVHTSIADSGTVPAWLVQPTRAEPGWVTLTPGGTYI